MMKPIGKRCLHCLRVALTGILLGISIGFIAPAYIGGVYYSLCGEHPAEQAYLDRCIAHLRDIRAICDDPDLQGILDYTIQRYSKVGAWDVMFFPLSGGFRSDDRISGCNCPFCPGITIDTSMLLDRPELTALVIVHEALHDYFPYFGHAHITPREHKFYKLSHEVQGIR
jgi:hypothetical protein